jgi:predicted transcriptional regulator
MKKHAPHAATIMDDDPIVLTEDKKLRYAAEKMWKQHAHASVLVDAERRPVGILSQQGLIRALLDVVNHDMPVGNPRQYLDPAVPTIEEDANLVLMAELFAKHDGVRALSVVRNEKLVGLVLRADVVHAVMEHLSGAESREQRLLYLSALRDRGETPVFD